MQLFLAIRFNCNKCHDHPFERWTQDQYYHMAAFFAQVSLAKDPKGGDQTIGGTAVEGAKPLFEIVTDAKEGEVKHDRTGKVSPPEFPFPAALKVASAEPAQPTVKDGKIHEPSGATKESDKPRREQLADWVTSPDNRFFASSYANRLWGYLLGTGIIEPLSMRRAPAIPRETPRCWNTSRTNSSTAVSTRAI